jgi:WD40 repeat protein
MKEIYEVKQVRMMLAQWVAAVKISGYEGYYDINRVSENLAMRLLNALYDYELENLNWANPNCPVIDLGCKKTKLAIQVTSRLTWQKISRNLNSFFNNDEFSEYQSGIRYFIISDEEPRFGKNNQEYISKKFPDFVIKEHLITIPRFMKQIERCYSEDKNRFKKIQRILEEEFIFFTQKVGRDDLLEKLHKGSQKYLNSLRKNGGRFRYLNISEIILPPTIHSKNLNFIDAPVKLNKGQKGEEPSHSLNVLNAIPHLWKEECKHALIVGAGGMGKTVSLIRLWETFLSNDEYLPNSPVPIFIPLHEYNEAETTQDRKKFIQKLISRYYLQWEDREIEMFDVFSTRTNQNLGKVPSVILLLDGFNEVTIDKTQLLIELREIFEHWRGIQVIISSRLDIRHAMNWVDIHLIQLLGLNEETIGRYLLSMNIYFVETNQSTLHAKLLELLRNPMMLTIYASTCEVQKIQKNNSFFEFKSSVESTGELLWNFLEAQQVKYFSQQGLPTKTKWYYRFLLKHLLPAVGYHMESMGQFILSHKVLMEIVNSYLSKLPKKDFFYSFPEYAKHEDILLFSIESKPFKNKIKAEVIDAVTDELLMLVKEGGSYRFIHQNFRDFFAAIHIINQIQLTISQNRLPAILTDGMLSYYPSKYIGEITREHHYKNNQIQSILDSQFSSPNSILLAKVIELCRNVFDGSMKFAVSNILLIWKRSRGDWAGLNLSHLDLTNVILNGVFCSHLFYGKYKAAKFDHSLLHSKNIFAQSHSSDITQAIYSPDGKRILSASKDQTIKEWSVATGKCLQTYIGHHDMVSSIGYNIDGTQILSASYDSTIKEWSVNSGECIGTYYGHGSWVYLAIYGADEKTIFSASRDATIKMWSIASKLCLKTFVGHASRITNVCESPKEGKIISSSRSGNIRVWSVKSGECLKIIKAHDSEVKRAIYIPGGEKILSISSDYTIKLWSVAKGKCIKTYPKSTSWALDCKISLDGKKILLALSDGKIREISYSSGKYEKTLVGHDSTVQNVSYSPDGRKILSSSSDESFREWSAETGECLRIFKSCDKRIVDTFYSPDKKKLALVSRDHTIQEWCVKTGVCIRVYVGHKASISNAYYSPSGEKIISASHDKTLREWSVYTGECIRVYSGHKDWVECAAYSQDEEKIISGSFDSTIMEWCTKTGKCIKTYKGHSFTIKMIAFGLKDKRILSASPDSTLREWSVETGECINVYNGQISTIIMAGYSNDGQNILSFSKDKILKEWCVESGACLGAWRFPLMPSEIENKYSTLIKKLNIMNSPDNTLKRVEYEYGKIEDIENIPGLWIQGCSFKNLNPKCGLSREDIHNMKMYGALGLK